MKVGLLVYGSNCDVDPMVALSMELAERGHHVEIFIISIHDRDYSFLNEYPRIHAAQKKYSAEVRNLPDDDLEYWKQPTNKYFDLMDRWYKATIDQIVDYTYKFCGKCDLIVGPQHMPEVPCIAEKVGIPFVSLRTLPAHVRSSKIAPYWLSFFDVDHMCYDEQWDLLESFENRSLKRYINKFRRQHGMRPIKNVMRDIINSPYLNLISYSTNFHRRQTDWDPTFNLCGFFRNPRYLNWKPSNELQSFLSNGEKPVFITIYSTLEYENDKKNIQELLLNVARNIERKVIIHSTWYEEGLSAESIYKLPGIVAFHRILPHCSLAVHHGGVGISHIATECGCPSVVIKYGCDHPFNADVLKRIGVCKHSIYRKDLTIKMLTYMIQDSIDKNDLLKNARRLSTAMSKEDGVTQAVSLIEQLASLKIQSSKINSE